MLYDGNGTVDANVDLVWLLTHDTGAKGKSPTTLKHGSKSYLRTSQSTALSSPGRFVEEQSNILR